MSTEELLSAFDVGGRTAAEHIGTEAITGEEEPYFAALGYEITVEESTVEESSSHGRLDMAVRTGGYVYLFEFKVAELAPPGSALAQLRERDYAAKYRGRGEPVHLIGVEFSRKTRNVTAFVGAGLRAFSQLRSFGFFRLDDLDPVLPQLLSSPAVDRRRGQNDARRAHSVDSWYRRRLRSRRVLIEGPTLAAISTRTCS